MKLAVALILGTLAYAADDGCKPVFEALDKAGVTASHMFSTGASESRKGAPDNGEVIRMGGPAGAVYVMDGGKWNRIKTTAGEMLKMSQDSRNLTKHTCRYVRDEAVNGEAAAVYSAHSETEDTKIDMTIRISKSKGLPLREDVEMDVGGAMGKSHKSVRYEYTNVRPPAGVQ
jgi:hypothetical protein